MAKLGTVTFVYSVQSSPFALPPVEVQPGPGGVSRVVVSKAVSEPFRVEVTFEQVVSVQVAENLFDPECIVRLLAVSFAGALHALGPAKLIEVQHQFPPGIGPPGAGTPRCAGARPRAGHLESRSRRWPTCWRRGAGRQGTPLPCGVAPGPRLDRGPLPQPTQLTWGGPRAGASAGARVGSSRCPRMALTADDDVTYARARRGPPHPGHVHTSTPNVLRSRPAQSSLQRCRRCRGVALSTFLAVDPSDSSDLPYLRERAIVWLRLAAWGA
jgi:hypothetical protein